MRAGQTRARQRFAGSAQPRDERKEARDQRGTADRSTRGSLDGKRRASARAEKVHASEAERQRVEPDAEDWEEEGRERPTRDDDYEPHRGRHSGRSFER